MTLGLHPQERFEDDAGDQASSLTASRAGSKTNVPNTEAAKKANKCQVPMSEGGQEIGQAGSGSCCSGGGCSTRDNGITSGDGRIASCHVIHSWHAFGGGNCDGEITTVQLDIAPFLLHGISHNFGTISIFPSLNHCMVVIYLLLHGRYLLWKCRPNDVVH